jgi:predicted CXXCH cytochrome family protein
VGIQYDNTVDTAFVAAATVKTTGGLRLYGATNTLECGSCHNVHDNTAAPFLRKSNAASALCKTCHIK